MFTNIMSWLEQQCGELDGINLWQNSPLRYECGLRGILIECVGRVHYIHFNHGKILIVHTYYLNIVSA